MADRQLKVTIVGDTKQLDRTLGRTETRLKRFGRNVNTAGGAAGLGGGFVGLGARGNAVAAAVAATALATRSAVKAAREAEIVLGQTSVAVNQAGLSWEKNSDRIDAAADRISKASSFDDESVLQSFQVFVRGQKDVEKSLELAALATDVARGRYTDLESATQLVNKAAMGQVGALRRAGIQIDKNATATEALARLQQTFGGAAEKYSESAAGSADRLRVAWENLAEEAGGPLSNALAKVTDGLTAVVESMRGAREEVLEFDSVDFRQKFADAFGVDSLVSVLQQLAPQIRAAREQFLRDIQTIPLTVKPTATGTKAVPSFGQPGFKPGKQGIPVTQVSNRLVSEELDARLSGNRGRLKGVLAKEADFIESALRDIRLTPSQTIDLKQALLGVTEEIRSMDEQVIADANDKQQAAKDAAARQKAALKSSREKAVAALEAQAQAFKDLAGDIKSSVLDRFDTKAAKIDTSRALADAKESLRVARMIGAPSGIKDAQRQLQDANLAIQRQKLEDTVFRVSAGPKGPMNVLTIGTQNFYITGDNPDAIADKVIAKINKRSKTTAGQSRGRTSGNPMHR